MTMGEMVDVPVAMGNLEVWVWVWLPNGAVRLRSFAWRRSGWYDGVGIGVGMEVVPARRKYGQKRGASVPLDTDAA
jgi:hypothetical protein